MKKVLLLVLAAALLMPAAATAKRGGGVAGTVASYDAGSGELSLELRSGRELTALVTDDSRVRCDDDDDDDASVSRRGRGGDDDDDDRSDDDDDRCGDDIAVGDTVRRARIEVIDGEAVWTKLKLVG